MGQQDLENYGSRLLANISKEFTTPTEWECVPGLMVIFGWAMLRKAGHDRETILKMVDSYMAKYDALKKAGAN